ncbi:HBS1-like protein isoform X3 [Hemiscyllium ocellatum]|uniref:HBS1-like protein isoform X3 n=1 Tax=Hemiscyllium ocellatum TaxID=170820 RepID=UPI0029668212|nr:HBS1-like protein isoform X3 [Hemiscyllium ocellatum]
MARHRNVRGLKYDEDFEDDDVYGQSVEDDYCISPATAAQFIYKRDDYNRRAFTEEPLEEGDEYAEDKLEEPFYGNQPLLSEVDQARLHSCLDKMREVLGESVSDQVMVNAVLNSQYDAHKALDLLLSEDCQQKTKLKMQSTNPTRKSTVGDIFYSSRLVDSKHPDSRLPVMLLDDTDNSSAFDLGILLSTKSELSCVSAPMAACESVNNESANEGEETSAQCISLLEMIQEAPNVAQTDVKMLNGPLTDQATTSSDRGINLADLIKASEHSDQDLNTTMLPLCDVSELPPVMNFEPSVRPASDISRLSVLTQNNTEGTLQPFSTSLSKLSFTTLNANHLPSNSSNAPAQNPDCLTSSLRALSLVDQLNQHQQKSNGLNNTLVTNAQSSPVDITGGNNLSSHQYGSPSLADLIEEHEKNSPNSSDSSSVPSKFQSVTSAHSAILPLGSLSLAQLASECQTKTTADTFTGSLSSLITSKPMCTSEMGKMSLFDLMTENTQQMPENSKAKDAHFVTCEIPHSSGKTIGQLSTDLNVLTQQNTCALDTDLLSMFVQKSDLQNTKPANYKTFNRNTSIHNHQLSKRTRTTSWTKHCCAEPSCFALAICFQNPVRKKKKSLLNIHTTFLYSRQVPETKGEDQIPLFEIKPFDFSTPSPDDIIKASQKKAFIRD